MKLARPRMPMVPALAGLLLVAGCSRTHTVLFPGATFPDAGGEVGVVVDSGGGAEPLDAPGLLPGLVSVGVQHACAIAEGALFCWGYGIEGDLGLGDVGVAPRATRVGADNDWLSVSNGSDSTIALKRDGSLWGWGANQDGILGLGDRMSRSVPTRIGTRTDWVSVSAHFEHACALASDRSVWCWGGNYYGEVGQADSGPSIYDVPVRVGADLDWIAVSAGAFQTCGIRTGGTLHCWGDNSDARLGVAGSAYITVPAQVGGASDWEQVTVGLNCICGIRAGVLYCWSAAGIGDVDGQAPHIWYEPTRVDVAGLGPVVDVSINSATGCVRDGQGTTACWGGNYAGQLGFGDNLPRPFPTPLAFGPWSRIDLGSDSLCGISRGVLYCAGSVSYGQPDDPLDINDFVPVPLLPDAGP